MAKVEMKRTALQQGNAAFKKNQYAAALDLYKKAVQERPELKEYVSFNIALAKKQLATSVEAIVTEKESVLIPNDKVYVDSTHLVNVGGLVKSDGYYKAINDDPHFSLSLGEENLKPGFYVFESCVAMASSCSSINTKLYYDVGKGFSENQTFTLPTTPDQEFSRVIYFTEEVVGLRFDPIEEQIPFEIKSFSIKGIDEVIARQYLQEQCGDDSAAPSTIELYQRYAERYQPKAADAVSYEEWIERIEQPSLPSIEEAKAMLDQMVNYPTISIVMPTYNTDENLLRLCIESVINQSYPYWELCIADDCSPKPHVMQTLRRYADSDHRIKVVQRKENGHISLASNTAIELASGDFIALLDHDDELARHALLYMAEAINQHPNAAILYSDEDKISQEGVRSDPHFKSDWNPDLFFSQNYISHLGVYRSDIIQKIGGFRTGVEGSQDYDLLLRCLPHVTHDQIIHIPKVLYHWRAIQGSTAMDAGQKGYTTAAGIKALQDYFLTNGPDGVTVERGLLPNTYKVNWPIPDVTPKVSLLIPTRDRLTITELAVRSILEKTTYSNYEIVILDNGSVEPETLAFFKHIQQEDQRVRVLRYDYPFNYSAINNFGVENTDGELVGLINNDVEVISPNWLTEMVSHAIRPDIGCVGAKLYYSNGTLQHAGVIVSLGGVAGHSHKHFPGDAAGYFARLKLVQNYSAVTAACLIIKRNAYKAVNGLNENDLKVAFNDVDFCLKIREAGYRNLWTPYAELYHHESISRGHEDTSEKKLRFSNEVGYMKSSWSKLLLEDPFYSSNLTKRREDFSIGF